MPWAKRLVDFLVGLEDTDQDTAIDDEPCDTDELGIAEGDDEPSLGSTGLGSAGPISYMVPVVSAGGELIHDCEGAEHDGREPPEDDEPSHGRSDQILDQNRTLDPECSGGCCSCSDLEQDDCDDEEDDPEELSEASGIGDQVDCRSNTAVAFSRLGVLCRPAEAKRFAVFARQPTAANPVASIGACKIETRPTQCSLPHETDAMISLSS
jgi:hypothetical protein